MPLDPSEPSLLSLEQTCRARLCLRPHALAERMVLALVLGLRGEKELALLEWDEALYQTRRHEDEVAQESCLALMRVLHPQAAGEKPEPRSL